MVTDDGHGAAATDAAAQQQEIDDEVSVSRPALESAELRQEQRSIMERGLLAREIEHRADERDVRLDGRELRVTDRERRADLRDVDLGDRERDADERDRAADQSEINRAMGS